MMLSIPTWNQFKANPSYQSEDGELFVNVNRKLQLFIRARRGVSETRSFNFSPKGYRQAVKWLSGQKAG